MKNIVEKNMKSEFGLAKKRITYSQKMSFLMEKIMIVIVVVAIMLFGVFGITGCDSLSLADYKATKIKELQAYIDAKRVDNYTVKGWEVILNAAEDGKKAIEDATIKQQVDTAVEEAKNAIDEVEMERDDGLNFEIRSSIINWSYLYLDLGQNNGVTREDIGSWWIDYYYGQYNGFHIFHFRVWGFGLECETVIDNLSFRSRGTLEILAVKEDCGMPLKELYEDGHINRADLEKIYKINCN